MNRLKRFLPLIIFIVSAVYYYALSSKIFTWIYTSGDAGDWLVQTNWWMVPQCWGKPFYFLLIKFTNIFPGDPVIKITMLSVISGAAIVMLVYMISLKLTSSWKLGIVASLVTLGCTIILSQATVLEQYTVVGALFLAFFYFYQKENWIPAAIFLGLTASVHELGLVFAVLFLVMEIRRIKILAKYIPIFLAFGILPYIIIPIMMADPETPKILAGFLSWGSLNAYVGNTTVTAALALIEAPARIKDALVIIVPSLGFALVPMFVGLKRPWNKKLLFAIACLLFVLWFYITNLFPSVWKWLSMVLPLAICYMAVGLTKLPNWHKHLVTIGAVVLIIANIFMFNTNTLAHESPQATDYYQQLMDLPDGSAIIMPRGGAYGFTVLYAISEGKDLIPICLTIPEKWNTVSDNQGYIDYLWWLKKEYGITGNNTYENIKDCLAKGHQVYFATQMTILWSGAFVYEENATDLLYRVTDIIEKPVFESTQIQGGIWEDYWQLRQRIEEKEIED